MGQDTAERLFLEGLDRGAIGFTFNSVSGNLTSLSAPGGLGLAFTYDGSLPTSVTWSGAVSGATAVTYNSDFRVTGQTVNGGHAVSFGYDLDGLLTQAGALGLRRSALNGRLDADSVIVAGAVQKSAYGYDSHGALSAMLSTRVDATTDTLFATSYVRDSLSRITQLTEIVNGTTQVVGFTYDSVGRLATVTRNSVVTASYTYDLNGNRATKTTSGGTVTATVDDQDRLVSYGGASYSYTNNGELTRKVVGTDTTLFTYDALGNLTQVILPDGTELGYLIDPQNRRIGRTVDGVLDRAWLYQGQLTPVSELDGQGNVVSRFVYATGVNVPDYLVRGDSTYRIVRDHLGSVRLVVNVASGTVAQRVSYDEFGIETENTNPGWQPFGYAGGLTDSETGLVRFGARDYDPQAGRWTAKDPIGFAGGTTGLYEYAANDPVNFVDSAGELPSFAVVAPAAKEFAQGAWSYVRGNYRSIRYLARVAGFAGPSEMRRAGLEHDILNRLLDKTMDLYQTNCRFRAEANRVLGEALLQNKAFMAGRVGAGSLVTLLSGAPAIGIAAALNAAIGDVRYAVEVNADLLSIDLIRFGLYGSSTR